MAPLLASRQKSFLQIPLPFLTVYKINNPFLYRGLYAMSTLTNLFIREAPVKSSHIEKRVSVDHLDVIVDMLSKAYGQQTLHFLHNLTGSRLCKNICNLFGCRDVPKSNYRSSHRSFHMVKPDGRNFCPCVRTTLTHDYNGASVDGKNNGCRNNKHISK